MQALWRLALWGGFATVALFVAVVATFSGASLRSATSALPSASRFADPDLAPQLDETAEETRRLSEAVRALSADRDQLVARIAVIERNLDNTGSIKRDRTGAQPASAAPQPGVTQPLAPTVPPAQSQTSQQPTQASAPSPASSQPPAAPAAVPVSVAVARPDPAVARPDPAGARPDPAGAPPWETAALSPQPSAPPQSGSSEIAKTSDSAAVASASVPARARTDGSGTPSGLGVDVGSAANFDGLRALWHSTKNNDPGLLEDLFPVVAARENGKTHGAELRLIIGPMADVESAARLCADLSTAHQYCQPVAFEGQPLSLNESAPPSKTASVPHHRAAPAAQPVPSVLKGTPDTSPYAKLTK
jgi:hypothetical protein